MPRRLRFASGGYVYHVLNRAVGRARLFHKDADYAAFVKILRQAPDFMPMRVLAWCLMPNHWHLVLWPEADGQLSDYLRWVTVTHTQRYHAHYHSAGTGPLYQGRFKSFPVQEDDHLLKVCRYAERNALRAGLVGRAEDWRWSSLGARGEGPALSTDWPTARPRDWKGYVNRPGTKAELKALREALRRGSPLGEQAWSRQTATALGLESTLRPRGRPLKRQQEE